LVKETQKHGFERKKNKKNPLQKGKTKQAQLEGGPKAHPKKCRDPQRIGIKGKSIAP
jgi:hypothetical protein